MVDLAVGAPRVVHQGNHEVLTVVAEVRGSREEEHKLGGVITAQQRDEEVRSAVIHGRRIHKVPDLAAQVSSGSSTTVATSIGIADASAITDGGVVRRGCNTFCQPRSERILRSRAANSPEGGRALMLEASVNSDAVSARKCMVILIAMKGS